MESENAQESCATTNVQGDGTQNSSLGINGKTSLPEEGDEQTAQKILLAKDRYGCPGTMQNLSRMPDSSMLL